MHAPAPFGSNVLLLIEEGLQDPDDDVRFFSSSALSLAIRRVNMGTKGQIDPRTRATTLVPIVASLLDDPVYEIRAGAYAKLSLLGALETPPVRARVIERYRLEQDPRVRPAIIDVLRPYGERSEAVQRVLVSALRDQDADTKQRAAYAVSRWRLPEGLPGIVAELRNGDETTRGEFVEALARYGRLARPHLSLLDSLRAVESTDHRRAKIEVAIHRIQQD
jgi:HEAT repeat protein